MNTTDWSKVLKGAVIAGLAAFLTFLSDALGIVELGPQVMGDSSFSSDEMVVDGFPPTLIWWGLSVLINMGWKWLQNNEG